MQGSFEAYAMIDFADGPISPEQRLFVGVIVNAAMEAAGASRPGNRNRAVHQSAHAWFEDDGDDFRQVCELAGLEPCAVRKRVLAYLTRVQTDPADAIKVKRGYGGGRKRGVSIIDVARRVGVSPTTVSNVIHKRDVALSTRASVLAAIDELGYDHHVH